MSLRCTVGALAAMTALGCAGGATSSQKFDFERQVGLASMNSTSGCLAINNTSLAAGKRVTLTWTSEDSVSGIGEAIIGARVDSACERNLGLSPLDDAKPTYYEIQRVGDTTAIESRLAFVIVDPVSPISLRAGRPVGDLDGDGALEAFHACASFEGRHLRVWSGPWLEGQVRWFRYYYSGSDTVPPCPDRYIADPGADSVRFAATPPYHAQSDSNIPAMIRRFEELSEKYGWRLGDAGAANSNQMWPTADKERTRIEELARTLAASRDHRAAFALGRTIDSVDAPGGAAIVDALYENYVGDMNYGLAPEQWFTGTFVGNKYDYTMPAVRRWWTFNRARLEARVAPIVTMRLSSDTILLGEPVWVVLTARNATGAALRWDPGNYCHMNEQVPVRAVVTGAAPGKIPPVVCRYGSQAGSCYIGGNTIVLAPGDSASWKFLLEGDFHFDSAGTYEVRLTSHPGKGHAVGNDTVALAPAVEVTQTRVLAVRPRNDAALLARAIQLAAEYESAFLSAMNDRGSTSAEREALHRFWLDLRQLRHGIAVYPAPGMETVFQRWLQTYDSEDDAILGLKNLNSVESRAMLATIATTPSKPNSYTQSQATNALSEMGDPQYYPLMVQHLSSRHEMLRTRAVWGVGRLGGAAGATVLLDLARKEPGSQMSGLAVTALGHTASRVAVQVLIDSIASRDGKPVVADWPLFVLTHHRLPDLNVLRTPEQMRMEWRSWWETVGKNAPVYTPYQCGPTLTGRG